MALPDIGQTHFYENNSQRVRMIPELTPEFPVLLLSLPRQKWGTDKALDEFDSLATLAMPSSSRWRHPSLGSGTF